MRGGAEGDIRLGLELLLWTVPALAAGARFARGRRGVRGAWLVVAAACAAIVADKAFDVQTVAHRVGQDLVLAIDPEHRMRGPHAWMRQLLLGGLFVLGVALLWLLARSDRALRGGKVVSLLGLVLVMGYLGLRMLPPVRERISEPLAWAIEGACWLLVVVGLAVGGPTVGGAGSRAGGARGHPTGRDT